MGDLMKERMKLLFGVVVVFISLLMVFACSDDGSSTKPTSETFTQTISANQETVVDYGEMLLNFEAGTVSESFELEIKELNNVENINFGNFQLIGDVYEVIHDEEVMFNNSVTISFDYESDNEIDPNNVFIARYLNGEWSKLSTTFNEDSQKLSAMTDQLCWFALFWGAGPDITEISLTPSLYSNVSFSADSFTSDLFVNVGYTDHDNEVVSAQISLSLLGGTIDNTQDLGSLLSSVSGDYEIIYLPFVAENMTNSIVLEMKKVNINYQYMVDKAALANLYQDVQGFDTLIFNVELLDSANNSLDSMQGRVGFYNYAYHTIQLLAPSNYAIPSPIVAWGFNESPDLDPEDYANEQYRLVIDEDSDPFSSDDKDYEVTVNFSDITDGIYAITHQVETELEIGEKYYFQVKVSYDGSFTGERVLETSIKSFTVVEEVIEDTENPSIGDVFIPAENSTVSGDVTIDIYATDNVGISQVNFGISSLSLNHQELGVDVTANASDHFSLIFDSSLFEDGQYTLRATAYDTNENLTSVTWPIIIDNTTSAGDQVALPYFNPTPASYNETQMVTINCSTADAELRYTLDGSEPNQETSQIYTSPLMISETTTIKAKGFKTDYEASETAVAYYEIDSSSQSDESIFVPAGTFTMGDTNQGIHEEELPTHEVTLSPFYIGKYEQTYSRFIEFLNSAEISPLGYYHTTRVINLDGQYCAIAYSDGAFYFEANEYVPSIECPVIEANMFGAIAFCNWLSEQEGLTPCYETNQWTCDMTANGYRLPTEAEWEYAARGASTNPDYIYSGADDINSVAWYNGNNQPNGTKEVGSKAPNSLGIYDMSGNVNEWCNDSYGAFSDQAQTNPTGADSGFTYVVKGGGWNSSSEECRVSYRVEQGPFLNPGNVGFRFVRNAE
jgi:formylglycine-generating enzyme required for sulfatase activity